MNRILLVEDDKKISGITQKFLEHAGFAVTTVFDIKTAQLELEQNVFCFAIFDVMLPDGSGFALLRDLREGLYFLSPNSTHIDTPVLMLTALGETKHVLQGLRLGADDYVTKPFEPMELVERVAVILKRAGHKSYATSTMQAGTLEIELTTRIVMSRGEQVSLNRREYDLLLFFCRNMQQVFSREQLIAQIWGMEFDGGDRSVDICVQRVRSKLKEHQAGLQIKTVWGVGYMMEAMTI
jgi:DNA-binding response OmpR family regulator